MSLISGIIITRLIGPEGKGIYAIFIANTELLSLFLGLSANAGIIYFIANRKIPEKKIIGLTILTFISSLFFGSMVIFIPFQQEELLFPQNFDSFIFKLYLFLCFLFNITNTLFSGIFEGHKKYGIINKIGIFNALFSLIIFGLLALTKSMYFFESILLNVLFYTLIIFSINTLMWLFYYIKNIKTTPSFKLSFKKEITVFFNYIGLGYVSEVLNFFNYRLDIWFINTHHGLEELGYYSLAVNVSKFLLMISKTTASVLYPYLSAERDRIKKFNLVALISRINTFLLTFGLIIMLILGKYLIPLVYGDEFTASVSAFRIILFATLFTGLTKTFATYLASENKIKFNLYATIVGLSITIIFNILLIPKYGIIGAAYTSLMAYFSIFAVVYYVSIKLNNQLSLNCFIITKNDILKLQSIYYEKFRKLS